jgi:hypothetical protein
VEGNLEEGDARDYAADVQFLPVRQRDTGIEVQTRVGELKAQGLGLAVITCDSPVVMGDFARRRRQNRGRHRSPFGVHAE